MPYAGFRTCYWIYGETGTGKSYLSSQRWPDAFRKPQNKWWDGYKGQKTVILDDLDTPVLAHYLKIWADSYGCIGECKGNTVSLQHTTLVITSNYSIEELFLDEKMRGPIARRFKEVHAEKGTLW